MQTLVLALLMRYLGNKHSIIIGLVFEMLQLFMLGFGSQPWLVESFQYWILLSVAVLASQSLTAVSSVSDNYNSYGACEFFCCIMYAF